MIYFSKMINFSFIIIIFKKQMKRGLLSFLACTVQIHKETKKEKKKKKQKRVAIEDLMSWTHHNRFSQNPPKTKIAFSRTIRRK